MKVRRVSRDRAPEGAREWWGIVSREHRGPTCRSAPSASACTRMATTLGVGFRWLAADQDDAARRIHDAVDVDPIHFERCGPRLI
jgi:hypothetical protein